MSFLSLFRNVLGCGFIVLFSLQTAVAQSPHAQAIANHYTSDVVGVFYVDLDRFDLEATLQTAVQLGFRDQGELTDLIESLPVISGKMQALKQAGFSRAYALLRSADLQTMGTSWVLPLKPGSDVGAAKETFTEIIAPLQPKMFANIGVAKGAILVAATPAQLEVLNVAPAVDHPARAEMWKTLGNGAVGLVLFGDVDSRRVIRELLPPLPVPFESINGNLIAEGLDWGGFELRLGGQPNLKVSVEAQSEGFAKLVDESLVAGYEVLQQLPQTKQFLPESEFGFVLEALKPSRSGNRVTVSTEALTLDMDRLAKVLAPQVEIIRAKAAGVTRMNLLRQLALASLNYESAFSRFPTQAKADADGKPLLSWRVQILPFMGKKENELYAQFHLDEPWDSEHNQKLIGQMPSCYKDLSPGSHQNNKSGKTIFMGPAGEGMVFNGTKEIGFRDITDGSSNTILLVAAAPAHAVTWTQPVDWQVDLKNPMAQITDDGRTNVEFVLADGSVHRIPIATDLKIWRGLIQAADGEIVVW